MSEKIITLAKKLKALAERGVDGEKVNAQRQLEKLMLKHGISFEMIEETIVSSHVFVVGKFHRLFIQVVASVMNNVDCYFGHRTKKQLKIVDCTAADAIEIQAKFDFYLSAYKKDLAEQERLFFKAFVQKNRLFTDEPAEQKELTPEERADIYKMSQLMQVMDHHKYLKQIG